MASTIHEEEQLGKALDWRLMKRLVGYLRPVRWLVIASIVMMLFVTVANLSRPYLIEVAIDRHMIGLTKPMVVYSDGARVPSGGTRVLWHGQTYIRSGDLPRAELNASTDWAQLLQQQGSWYLVSGSSSDFPLSTNAHVATATGNGGNVLTPSGRHLTAQKLGIGDIGKFRQQDVIGITQLSLLYLGAIAVAFALNYVQTYMIGYAVQKAVNNLRMDLFSHLQKLNLAYFDKNPAGRIVTRVMNDCQTINDMYANVLMSLFQDVFTLIGIVVVLLKMNVSLALVSFVVIPLILVATGIYRKYARDAFRTVRVKLARINATLAENISGMRIIHMFQRQEQVYRRFHDTNADYLKSSLRELLTFAVFRPSMDFLYYFALALVLWVGGLHVLGGTLAFGVLYAFTNYVQQFFQPISDLSEKYNLVQQAMASSERVFEMLDNDDYLPDNAHVPVPDAGLGKVEFRNVWFAYVGEEWVLRDVSFVIEPGQTVAFVGATGAGKSSILSLISRFYDVQKGEILVDDVDVRDWPLAALRRRVGVVLQDVFLFSGTVADNIRLGEAGIDADRIQEVVRYVNAEPFIEKLPGGLGHRVQERGSTFSAGERQLIAFARALAFDPDVLVLDEATANIDTETEQWIQQALVRLTKERTTIVVAHRLSTIQHADNIIVLHKGRVRESGTHQALLQTRGLYWNLYQLQYREQESAATSGA